MKNVMKLIPLLMVILTLTSYSKDPVRNFKQTNSAEFNRLIKSKPGILLDVRTLGEYQNGHIEEAGQLNYYALNFKQKLTSLPKNQPIYVYCNTGYRSERAARLLSEQGYTEIYNLEHGIMEWNLMELPVVVDPNARPDQENLYTPTDFSKLITTESLVMIDFYAPWCAPCRSMMPMIDSLMVAYHPDIRIVKINVDASKNLAKELKLNSVPHFKFYRNGKEMKSLSGVQHKNELTTLLDSFNKP